MISFTFCNGVMLIQLSESKNNETTFNLHIKIELYFYTFILFNKSISALKNNNSYVKIVVFDRKKTSAN